jgi:hypothetical protein
MSAQPLDVPRPVILAHGSLRHADFRDRVAAVARAGSTASGCTCGSTRGFGHRAGRMPT